MHYVYAAIFMRAEHVVARMLSDSGRPLPPDAISYHVKPPRTNGRQRPADTHDPFRLPFNAGNARNGGSPRLFRMTSVSRRVPRDRFTASSSVTSATDATFRYLSPRRQKGKKKKGDAAGNVMKFLRRVETRQRHLTRARDFMKSLNSPGAEGYY